MATRKVTAVGRDTRGRIIALGNPGSLWSPVIADTAADEIEAGEHVYVADAGTARQRIGVVNRSGRRYLRTIRDRTDVDNLDLLPSLGGIPATGGYDVVVDAAWRCVEGMVRAAHAAGAVQTAAYARTADLLVAAYIGYPQLEPTEATITRGEAAEVEITTRLVVWCRVAEDPLAEGFGGVADVQRAVRLQAAAGTGASDGRIALQLQDVGPPQISLIDTPSGRRDDIRRAVRAVLSTPSQAWSFPVDRTVPPPRFVDITTRSSDGDQRLQVGACYRSRPWAGLPPPKTAPWAVALSSDFVSRAILSSIGRALGGLPPPTGPGPVAVPGDPGTQLERLTVRMRSGGFAIEGRATSGPGGSAGFNVLVDVSLAADGRFNTAITEVEVDLGLFGSVANFFSGGALARELQNAIESSFARVDGPFGSTTGFFSLPLLSDVAMVTSSGPIDVEVRARRLLASSRALVVSGDVNVTGADVIVPVAMAHRTQTPGRVTLVAVGSWVRGGEIDQIRWRVNGTTVATSGGNTLSLGSHQDLPAGDHTIDLEIIAVSGVRATQTINIRV
jgi:hypothetical protein